MLPAVLTDRRRDRVYAVGRRIAAGGMGEVYAGTLRGSGRLVAIKRMLDRTGQEEDLLRLFLREVFVASTLEHPNVAEVIDVGLVDQELFLVMELVEGPTLAEILETLSGRGEKLPLDVALGIATHVARGLAYAHDRALPDGTPLGIVHRDIAPENVLVGQDGVPKLVDFGLAKLDGQDLTQPGVIRGRPRSLAPEQARGAETDARTDVFALGNILCEMTAGERLYPSEAVASLLWKVAAGDYPPVAPRLAHLDPDLVAIIERALAPAPADRPRSARQLERALGAFQASREIRVSHAAIAETVAAVWEHARAARARVLEGSAAELEGALLTLPADELEPVAPAPAPPSSPPSAPGPKPRPPRPAGWDRVTPLPEAPARAALGGDPVGRAWTIYGVVLLALAAGLSAWVYFVRV